MNKTVTIGGKKVLLSEDGQTIEIEGMAMSLETFLTITEFVLTGSDLKGSNSDGIDPRFKFVAVVGNLHRTDGHGAGTSRLKAPHYLTMFGTGSQAPMA